MLYKKKNKMLCKMNAGISFNPRTKTISQGWVLRLGRTKNQSGSICSVIYLVYLKHAMGPTFLNLWNRIKWSLKMRTENPQRGLNPSNRKRIHFLHLVPCHFVFSESPSSQAGPHIPSFPSMDFDQEVPCQLRSWLPKRAAAPHPESLPPQQTY